MNEWTQYELCCDSPELLQVLKVLEISLLYSTDWVPVQVQELEVREHAQSVPGNRPARRTAGRQSSVCRSVFQ